MWKSELNAKNKVQIYNELVVTKVMYTFGVVKWTRQKLEDGVSFHFYADDFQLYTSFTCNDTSDLEAAKQRLESCVADINLWMTTNKLKTNQNSYFFTPDLITR